MSDGRRHDDEDYAETARWRKEENRRSAEHHLEALLEADGIDIKKLRELAPKSIRPVVRTDSEDSK